MAIIGIRILMKLGQSGPNNTGRGIICPFEVQAHDKSLLSQFSHAIRKSLLRQHSCPVRAGG